MQGGSACPAGATRVGSPLIPINDGCTAVWTESDDVHDCGVDVTLIPGRRGPATCRVIRRVAHEDDADCLAPETVWVRLADVFTTAAACFAEPGGCPGPPDDGACHCRLTGIRASSGGYCQPQYLNHLVYANHAIYRFSATVPSDCEVELRCSAGESVGHCAPRAPPPPPRFD